MSWTKYGKEFLAKCMMGEIDLTSLNLKVGVGDSSAVFDEEQTDLQGVNTLKKGMLPGFPSRSENGITLAAEFLRSEANFDWEEWGVFDNAGNMYYRKIENNGTKTSNDSRIFYPVIKAGEK